MYIALNCPSALTQMFFDNEWAVPFVSENKNILVFHPIKMEMYLLCNLFGRCLQINKNQSGDIEAITRSYLDYIFFLGKNGNSENLVMLIQLLLMCLQLPPTYTDENGKVCDSVEVINDGTATYLRVQGKKFTCTDFDKIRLLISEQNSIELPREDVHPDIQKAYERYKALKNKNSDSMGGVGDCMDVVMIKTAYKKEEILNMPIRTFFSLLSRIDTMINYELSTILAPYTDKKKSGKIQHYLAAKMVRDKYKEMYVDYDEFKMNNGL